MLLNHIVRKCTGGYKFTNLQEKIDNLMYMDDIYQFTKNDKDLETLIQLIRIYSQDIGMEFGIEKCARKIGKRQKTEEIKDQEIIQTLGKKETYKYLRVLEADTIKKLWR